MVDALPEIYRDPGYVKRYDFTQFFLRSTKRDFSKTFACLLTESGENPNGQVADFGAGTGKATKILQEQLEKAGLSNTSVIAVEGSKAMMDQMSGDFTKIRADTSEPLFEQGSLEGATAMMSSSYGGHMPQRLDLMVNAVKEGGIIAIMDERKVGNAFIDAVATKVNSFYGSTPEDLDRATDFWNEAEKAFKDKIIWHGCEIIKIERSFGISSIYLRKV